jgi:hypothetical protein
MVAHTGRGLGFPGAKVPEVGLYPSYAPSPNGLSWISGEVHAMHGGSRVERIDLTWMAHRSVIRIDVARARFQSLATGPTRQRNNRATRTCDRPTGLTHQREEEEPSGDGD